MAAVHLGHTLWAQKEEEEEEEEDVKKFSSFYKNQRLIAMFTTANKCTTF